MVGRRAINSKGRGGNAETDRALAEQQHAASATALVVLVHTLLTVLRQRLRAADGSVPRLLLLRAQSQSKQPDDRDPDGGRSGSEGLYAVAKALGLSLAAQGPVFMQGFALDRCAGDQARYQRAGTFAALQSAFPLRITGATSLPTISLGLINYSTRPCGSDPSNPDNDRFLYTVKSYLANGVPANSATLRLEELGVQLHLQTQDDFDDPAVIQEEIARLHRAGCGHVLLLWQHYGNRRIGRAARHHAPHSSPRFLARIAERFPDLTLYSLRRDVFPALRMTRGAGRAGAYEVVRVREHEGFWHPEMRRTSRDVLAFYTFATLAVVGEESRRPQSGFCTYFLESTPGAGNLEWSERPRANLIDPNGDSPLRPALIALLRGLHFLHAQREAKRGHLRPVLDPHRWIAPDTIGGAGELKVMSSRRRGGVVLSFPAILARVDAILRRTAP